MTFSIFPADSRPVQKIILGALLLATLGLFILSSLVSLGWTLLVTAILLLFFIFVASPTVGVYCTIIALPLINWNFYIRGLIVPVADLAALLALAAFFLRAGFNILFGNRQAIRFPYIGYFSLFFLVAVASAWLADSLLGSLWYTVRWIGFVYLAFVVMPVNLIKTERQLRNAIICFLVSASAVALIGIISLFLQDWQTTFVRVQPIALFDIFPIGQNQNLIAEFLVIAVFATIALTYWTKKSDRVLKLVGITLALVALGTFSRAAWLSLGIGTLAYIIFQPRHLRRQFVLPLILSLIILMPLAAYMVKLQSEFSIGVSSTENRLLLTRIATQSFLDNPLFGQGAGSFVALVENNIRFRAQYGDPLDSHGVLQKIIAETGAIGLLSFLAFALAVFGGIWQGVRAAQGTRTYRFMLPLFLAALVGFMFQFFNTSYYKGKVWLPIALALAASLIVRRDPRYVQPPTEKN